MDRMHAFDHPACHRHGHQNWPRPAHPPRVTTEFATITEALDTAQVRDTVIVAAGTYHEHDLTLRAGVSLVSETGRYQDVTIDADSEGRCLELVGEDCVSLIKGLTFTNGDVVGHGEPPDNTGGGIYGNAQTTLLLEDCLFTDNTASRGGGLQWGWMVAYPYGLFIDGCVFRNNTGGGIHAVKEIIVPPWPTEVKNTVFEGNVGYGYQGAGNFTDCSFVGNIGPGMSGRGIFLRCTWEGNQNSQGGALWSATDGVCTLTECKFLRNVGGNGGAIWSGKEVQLERCLFVGNSCDRGNGGAVYGHGLTISGCTFVGNTSGEEFGSGIYARDGNHIIEGTIIAQGVNGSGLYIAEGSSYSVRCCDIWGNEGGDWVGRIANLHGEDGNIRADPLFCNPDNEDYSIETNSPCAGTEGGCGLIGAMEVGCR